MESRKYQLQKQIVGALKDNDNDLYVLLKSQWAHRFGVESLEELKNLDLDQENQNLINSNNQKIDKSEENSSYIEKAFHVEEDINQEKEMRSNKFDSTKDNNEESIRAKPHQNSFIDGNNDIEKNLSKKDISHPKIEALVPLPPKPKYSYLKKWLLISYF